MSTSPLVEIVILNWNNAPDTLECLNSVFQLSYDNFRVLVVDNGSRDDSVAQIKSNYPNIRVLETGANLGYAEGNNVGIRYVVQAGADYVFILNNDTLVEPTMLTKLVEVAESNSDIGIAGPTMYCTDPTDKLFAAGSFVLWKEGDLYQRGMFQSPGPYTQTQTPELVDFIIGCGVLVRREFIEKVGVLNSLYYLNYEDVEWGIRGYKYGFKVLYVPQAIMWHKVSATLGQTSPANTYYMTRNALLFFWRNASTYWRWIVVIKIILRTLRTIGSWTLRLHQDQNLKRKRVANLLALRDFFLGRFGEMGSDVARVCYGR